MKYLDFIQFSDGTNSILEIAKYIKIPLNNAKKIFNVLKKNNLVKII